MRSVNVMKVRITISLDKEISQKLQELHNKSDAPVSAIINRILKKELKLK